MAPNTMLSFTKNEWANPEKTYGQTEGRTEEWKDGRMDLILQDTSGRDRGSNKASVLKPIQHVIVKTIKCKTLWQYTCQSALPDTLWQMIIALVLLIAMVTTGPTKHTICNCMPATENMRTIWLDVAAMT